MQQALWSITIMSSHYKYKYLCQRIQSINNANHVCTSKHNELLLCARINDYFWQMFIDCIAQPIGHHWPLNPSTKWAIIKRKWNKNQTKINKIMHYCIVVWFCVMPSAFSTSWATLHCLGGPKQRRMCHFWLWSGCDQCDQRKFYFWPSTADSCLKKLWNIQGRFLRS